jgi:MtaA/CmuA family methyltransferase
VISPADYEEWAFPYERKVIEAWKAYGAKTLLHICGDSSKVLHLYAQTGADVIEIDHKVDLALARELVGDRCCLIGNVDPVTVLLQGTPEQVRACPALPRARRGGGYLLGSGCVVPRITPLENVRAMVQAAQASGRSRPDGPRVAQCMNQPPSSLDHLTGEEARGVAREVDDEVADVVGGRGA